MKTDRKAEPITLSPPGVLTHRHSWPRNLVKTVETRKRDLVIRITDWTRDRDEPAWDVETYVHGVYDWNESESFLTRNAQPKRTRAEAKKAAIEYAQKQIAKLL